VTEWMSVFCREVPFDPISDPPGKDGALTWLACPERLRQIPSRQKFYTTLPKSLTGCCNFLSELPIRLSNRPQVCDLIAATIVIALWRLARSL
jgi:hypothetical protein